MLKFKIDSLDGLDDATKALYEKSGEKFVLKIEGLEDGDTAGMKKQLETLLTESKDLKKKLKEKDDAEATVREEARRAAEEAAAKKGDIEALRKSVDERVAATRAEVEAQYKPQVEKLNGTVRRLLVDNVAQASAARIAIKGSESVLLPHIVSRLDVEDRNGELVTVVKGADGKASAMSVADLEKELSGNAAFAPLIVGSKGSGGGAGGSRPSGGGANGGKSIKRAEFDALSPAARMEHMSTGGVVTD